MATYNTITGTIKPDNTTKVVQIKHPNTGAFIDGTRQSNGDYLCVATNVSAGSYPSVVFQLKGSNPPITVTYTAGVTVDDAPTTPSPQPYTLTPTANDFEANGGTAQVQSEDGRERHLEMARLRTVINSPSSFNLTVRVKETNVNARYLSTFINGTIYQNIPLPTDVNTLSIPVPAGNGVEVLMIEPAQDRDGDVGRILGGTILSLGPFPAGTSAYFRKKTYTKLMIWCVDSIGSGTDANPRQLNGFAQRFNSDTTLCVFIGYGGAQTNAQIGTPELRNEKFELFKKLIEEAGNPADVSFIDQSGTNTYYNNGASPTQFAAMKGAFFQLLHDYRPATKLYAQTLFTRTDYTDVNAGGFNFRNYVDAVKGIPAAFPSLGIKIPDGEQLATVADLDNGKLHFSDEGHGRVYARYVSYFTDGTYGTGTTPDPGDGGTTPTGTWRTASPPNGSEIVVTNDTPGRPNIPGQVSGWNSCVYGLKRVKQPAVGVTGEIARFTWPFPTDDLNGPVSLGYATEKETTVLQTAAPGTANSDARDKIVHGGYHSGQVLSQIGTTAGYDEFHAADGDISFVVIADGNGGAKINSYQANRSGAIRDDRTVPSWPLYLRGVLNTGNGTSIPKIVGVTHTGSHLESY